MKTLVRLLVRLLVILLLVFFGLIFTILILSLGTIIILVLYWFITGKNYLEKFCYPVMNYFLSVLDRLVEKYKI